MNYPTQKMPSKCVERTVQSNLAAALLAAGVLSVSLPVHADLPPNALLTINAGQPVLDANGNQTNVSPGSWFGMDTNGNSAIGGIEKTALAQGTMGLLLGVTTSAGASHGGPPTGSDTNAITAPWYFFGNTGSDYVIVAPNVLSASGSTATVNFSGWIVTWNGIPAINMGGGAWGVGFTNGVANVTCTSSCADGESYTLEYTATVPNDGLTNFGNVRYKLHLEGMVVTSPRALNDSSITTVGNAVTINVLANDAAPNGIDPTSVTVVSPTTQLGTAVANATTGVVTYTPPASFSGTDTFAYTFRDRAGTPVTSNSATVTVAVQINVAPTANNDTASAIAGTSTAIDVLANDTDPNGTTARGNISPASVQVTQQPSLTGASVSVNPTTGAITYTAGTAPGSDSFQYTVQDADGATSNPASVSVTVRTYSGDWTNPIAAGTVPILMIESGSYFTMQLTPTNTARTNLSAGADGGVILGMPQYAAGSHINAPTGNEVTGIDSAWSFFSNTGMHFTSGGGIGVNTGDGTLDFSNWRVTWNSIPAINMGGAPADNSVVRGKAAIVCSPAPCVDGSTYTLNYSAHVPDGDASGFGGVPYGLYLQGRVRFLNTALASNGTISQGSLGLGMRLTATDLINNGIPADTAAGTQCVGDCFDFQVTNLTLGRAKVVLPLIFGIRPNSTYRKYTAANGWHDFDTTTLTLGVADTVKSAPLVANSGNCPAVGDASYTPGLTAGNRCVQLDIADNGPNDADPTPGTIADPSGVAAGAVVAPPDNRVTGSSGCSLSTRPVNPLDRGDWWLLLGFVVWMGFVARRKRA